jgi:hypothetical protein
MTVSLHNRRKLEMAIRCLLDGTVTPPDTKLTWKNVAAVAGISKATADRALDLRDEFRRQIEARVPPRTTRLQVRLCARGDANDANEELACLRREHAELKESTKVLHSVILALIQENQWLARRRRHDNSSVIPLTEPNKPPKA